MELEDIITGAVVLVASVLICFSASIIGTVAGATPHSGHVVAGFILTILSL